MDYKRIYFSLIESARNTKCDGYYEVHHIIPKSIGGDNSNSNKVKLTARQHLFAHKLLAEFTHGSDKKKMKFALWLMVNVSNKSQIRKKVSSREYERLRTEHSNTLKTDDNPLIKLNKSGQRYSWKGKKMSDSSREKMKKNHWSKKPNFIPPTKDKKMSQETKDKISKARSIKNPKLSKPVYNIINGDVFETTKLAAKAFKMCPTKLALKLKGIKENNTPLRYVPKTGSYEVLNAIRSNISWLKTEKHHAV